MKKQNFIEKLENLELPEIELQGHKLQLRSALLSSKYFKKKTGIFWVQRFVPASLALIFLIALGVTVINPKLMEARALVIARKDPQIQQLMQESGVIIKEAKVKGDRGYVLLMLPEEELPPKIMKAPEFNLAPETMEAIGAELPFLTGSIAEVNLKTKKVDRIQRLTEENIPIIPLTGKEEIMVIEIINGDAAIKKLLPAIEQMETIIAPMPPMKLHLKTDNSEIKVSADPGQDRRANVVLRFQGEQHIITVNLTQGKTEGLIQE